MTTFATKSDVLATLEPVREAIERLPVGGTNSLDLPMGAWHRLVSAVSATELVEPAKAAGTRRYREVRRLGPIEVGAPEAPLAREIALYDEKGELKP